MKQSLILARGFSVFLLLCCLTATHFQDEELQRIGNAIKQNDVTQLLSQTGNQLQVNVFGESNLYSQTQARYVLEAFFRSNPGREFVFSDTWNGATGTFAVGTYQSRQQPIQVYIRTQKISNKTQLKEIRFSQSANRR